MNSPECVCVGVKICELYLSHSRQPESHPHGEMDYRCRVHLARLGTWVRWTENGCCCCCGYCPLRCLGASACRCCGSWHCVGRGEEEPDVRLEPPEAEQRKSALIIHNRNKTLVKNIHSVFGDSLRTPDYVTESVFAESCQAYSQ